MATHSSILAWRIPGTEEPGGLQSVGLQRVKHARSDWAQTHVPYSIKKCLLGYLEATGHREIFDQKGLARSLTVYHT